MAVMPETTLPPSSRKVILSFTGFDLGVKAFVGSP